MVKRRRGAEAAAFSPMEVTQFRVLLEEVRDQQKLTFEVIAGFEARLKAHVEEQLQPIRERLDRVELVLAEHSRILREHSLVLARRQLELANIREEFAAQRAERKHSDAKAPLWVS